MTGHLELEELSALLDGELERVRAEEARRHLAGCAECTARLAGMQRSVATLRGLATAPPPPEILHRIRRQTASITPNPGLLERLGDWLHPPALRPAFAAAFSLVFAAVLAVYGLNVYYGRQVAPSRVGAEQPLEAFLRSGVPPGPSGQSAATGRVREEKDKEELRALGYLSAPQAADQATPAASGAAKKAAAVAAPPRPASPPAPATRLEQGAAAATRAEGDRPALNTSMGATGAAAGGAAASGDAGETAAAVPPPDALASSNEVGGRTPSPELQKVARETAIPADAEAPHRAKAAAEAAAPETPAVASPSAGEVVRRDAFGLRQAAGRSFTKIDGMWVEHGIRMEARRLRVAADSAAGRALIGRLSGLEPLLSDAGVVILRDGGKIVELRSSRSAPH